MNPRPSKTKRAWAVHPAGPGRWEDLAQLFGPHGACSGCWCMYRRLTRHEADSMSAEQRRNRLRRLVRSAQPPGLIGYDKGEPVAWVSVGPRTDFAALEASRLFRRVDDRPVWSVVCFFVRRDQRRQGWMRRLLRAAADYAAQNGATRLEGYPIERGGRTLAGDSGFTGVVSTFLDEGFHEVARPRVDRPIMRRTLRPRRAAR